MLHLSQDPDADQLISESPLALLIGLVLDQQVPLEWAFAAPAELERRLGGKLDVVGLACMDPEALRAVFSERPALHRYPGSMAKRVQDLCKILVDEFDARPEGVWEDVADGKDLFERIRALPGFGEQKAKIFVALLGKQLGVRPRGWREASAPFGEPGTYRSVADIFDEKSLAAVRSFKQEMKAGRHGEAPAPKKKAAR